jgi:beta-galactosidase
MRSIQGTRVYVDTAILCDYNDLWALNLQPHNRAITYWRHLFAYHRAFLRNGVPVDIISVNADLSHYKLVVAPSLILADDALATHLTRYVKSGGTLVLGVRCGFKTPISIVTDQPLPGPFRKLTGATIEAWHSIPPNISYPMVDYKRKSLKAQVWAEGLSTQSARPVMAYTSGSLEGLAAVTINTVGRGRAVYAGVWPVEPVVDSLVSWISPQVGVESLAILPEGVLVYQRGDFVFLLNFTDSPAVARLNVTGLTDEFAGRPVEREVTIAARNVRVFRK